MTPITPMRCLLDVLDIPPSAFALPCDGRQEKHLCRQRKAMAEQVARRANSDGTGARPEVETMAKGIGCSLATAFNLLRDLDNLGFVTPGKLAKSRGPRFRTVHVARMQAVSKPELFSSQQLSDSNLQNVGLQSSRHSEVSPSPLSDSNLQNAGLQSSRQTLPPLKPKPKPKPGWFDPADVELPEWLSQEVWRKFVEYRRQMKKPLTELMANANIEMLSELQSRGQDPPAVINQTIANGWSGLFPVNAGKKKLSEFAPAVKLPPGSLTASEQARQQRAVGRMG
jgi:hypothetical protein